jgi:hypothetical protein
LKPVVFREAHVKPITLTTMLGMALFAAGQAVAAPTVTGVSGTVQEGSAVTVTGSGFGTFDGTIVTWDDFEAHALGARIHNSSAKIGGTWTTQGSYAGAGARYEGSRTHSGSRAAYLDWSVDTNTIRAFGWAGRGPYTRLFISYWRYMAGNYTAGTDNHKQFYLFGNNGDFPQLMPCIPAGQSSWGVYNNVSDSSLSWNERNNMNTLGWSYSNTRDTFQRWDYWFVLNDVNVANGTVKSWLNGKLGISTNSYNTRRVNGAFDDFRLGHMAQGFTDTAKAWYDDVYIATTQARVELCDKPTWTECTKREIQIVQPSSWTAGELTFTLRKGGYDGVAGKYVYVIDSSGNVNSSGYPLTLSATVPKAPFNVALQ